MKTRFRLESLETRMLLTVFNPATAAALTTALNSAQLGDTIVLNAGTTYAGQFTLPNKTTGSGWITIQSSALDKLPAEGVRVTPNDAVNMPRIQAPGSNASAIRTPAGSPSHHFKMIGIEIVGPANNSDLTALMELGTSTVEQSTMETVPHDFVIDRCYFRPNIPTASIRRAIALNSATTDIVNSYIEEIHQPGSDSQAIAGWNGPGPYNIINNRLEGASENIMFGGDTTRLVGAVPSDIVIRGNHIIKPLHWRSLNYNVKNLFELKAGSNVLVENNILENNWTQGQSGVAIVLKLGNWSAATPQIVTEDVTIRNNIIRNTNGAVALQGRDYESNSPEGLVRRISFTNNLFDNVNGYWGTSRTGGGTFNIYLTHGPKDVTFDHNTFRNGYTSIEVDTNSDTYENDNFKFNNNIIDHNQYGVRSPVGTGNATFNAYLSDGAYEFTKNVIVNTPWAHRNSYTSRPGNFLLTNSANTDMWANVGFEDIANHNFRLAASSPYNNAGTDGQDIGADIDVLEAAVAGVANLAFPGYGASTADNFSVRRLGPGGSRIEVINSAWPVTPAPTETVPNPVSPFIDGDVFLDNFAYYQSINLNTTGGDDGVTLDYTSGSPIPTGTTGAGIVKRGLLFDGGIGTDTLAITGNGSTTATYTPHATTLGRGNIAAGGAIEFFAAESITGSALAGFTLVTPNANDNLTIDTPSAGQFRVGGTSGVGTGIIPATLAASVPLTIDAAANDAGGGNDTITVAAGANPMTSLAVNAGTGSNSLTANGGDFALNTNLGVRGVNLDVNVNNAGTEVTLPGTQRTRSLNIAAGGDVVLPANGSSVLRTTILSITGAGSQLNLSNNDLILDYAGASQLGTWNGSEYTAASGVVAAGRNGGSFDGTGIISNESMALGGQTMFALGEASDVLGISGSETATYGSETLDATSVIVKYTWSGDANLDGELNGDDYFAIDSHVLQSGSVFGFANGDFDLNGEINGDDYFLLDSTILFAQGYGSL